MWVIDVLFISGKRFRKQCDSVEWCRDWVRRLLSGFGGELKYVWVCEEVEGVRRVWVWSGEYGGWVR